MKNLSRRLGEALQAKERAIARLRNTRNTLLLHKEKRTYKRREDFRPVLRSMMDSDVALLVVVREDDLPQLEWELKAIGQGAVVELEFEDYAPVIDEEGYRWAKIKIKSDNLSVVCTALQELSTLFRD